MWSHAALLSNGFLMRESGREREAGEEQFEKQGEISVVLLRALTLCACVRARACQCEAVRTVCVCAHACTI